MSRLLLPLVASVLVVACGRGVAPQQRCHQSTECPMDRVCSGGFCLAAEGLSIVTERLPSGEVGGPYEARVEARGGSLPFSFSLAAGAGLPEGLVLLADGVLAGTPTRAGSAAIEVQVVDATGVVATRELAVAIDSASQRALEVVTAAVPEASLGAAYEAGLVARGGAPPYSWTVASGLLPAGMTLTPAGLLTGTPATAGAVRFTVQVADASSPAQLATANLELRVLPANGEVLAIVTTGVPGGEVGAPYSITLQARGGVPSYRWSLAAGTSLPSGLWLDRAGRISGAAARAGTSTFTVQVADSSSPGQVAAAQLSITVGAGGLTIVTAALPGARVGQPYGASIAATGGSAPHTLSAAGGSLPPGLQLSSRGELAGTPSSAGTFAFTIQATDSSAPAQVATRSFSLTIFAGSAAPLRVTSPTLPDAAVGRPYDVQLAASGGVTPYSWSLDLGGTLPAGLTLSSEGRLSGVPTVAGRFTVTLLVIDDGDPQQMASAALSITVLRPGATLAITTGNLPDGAVGNAYRQELSATAATPPWVWVVAGGALPPGLSLSADGLLAGTPAAAGTFNFAAQVSDGSSPTQSAQASFTLTIGAGLGLSIAVSGLPPATVGLAYQAQLTAEGGVPPYSWSIESGALPSGLGLSTSGVLSGTPTSAGTFSFAVEVTDAGGLTAIRQYVMAVLANPSSSLGIVTGVLPSGTVGVQYGAQVVAAGGLAPYAFVLVGGSLPPGLTLEPTGRIEGVPTTSGTFSFSVRVTDSSSPALSADRSFTVTVSVGAGQLLVTTHALPPGLVGVPYAATLAAANGTPPYTWAVADGTVPEGLALATSGTLSGTPTRRGTYTFTVQVTDASAESARKQLSVLVRP